MSPHRNKTILLAVILSFLFPVLSGAQTDINQLDPEEYFDFWVGTWELTWQGPDGSTETGTNKIEKILDGTVILENFSAQTGRLKGFDGKSFSVYQKSTETWKQTWVDNSGGYIALTGKFEGNKRIFITEATDQNGEPIIKRMVFYDISKNSFTWDWQSSSDKGETWETTWSIQYKRK